MSSSKLGKESSVVEVTNISANGIWVLVNNEELFLAHEEFPWFKQAVVEHVLDVQQVSPGHLYSNSENLALRARSEFSGFAI